MKQNMKWRKKVKEAREFEDKEFEVTMKVILEEDIALLKKLAKL